MTNAPPTFPDSAAPAGAPEIRGLRARERQAAALVLASAFRDNPLNRAVIGEGAARRLACNLSGMRATLAAALRGNARLLTAVGGSGPQGLLLALPPGRYPLGAPSLWHQLRCLAGQGFGVMTRWGRVFEHLDAVHPLGAHWYLGLLGVAPAQQGRGLGASLLGRWLREVDAEGGDTYLETDRERNVAFYRAAGFEVREELQVLGVPIWCMWRPSRARVADPSDARASIELGRGC